MSKNKIEEIKKHEITVSIWWVVMETVLEYCLGLFVLL